MEHTHNEPKLPWWADELATHGNRPGGKLMTIGNIPGFSVRFDFTKETTDKITTHISVSHDGAKIAVYHDNTADATATRIKIPLAISSASVNKEQFEQWEKDVWQSSQDILRRKSCQ